MSEAIWHKMTPEIRKALESARPASCVCGERPCQCNNGWGKFETEAELLSVISAEIQAEEFRLREPLVGQNELAAEWMLEEGYDPSEIANELGMSLARVRRVARNYDY